MFGRVAFLLGLLAVAALASPFGELTNKEWTRTIYLRTQIAKHQNNINVQNTGSSDASAYFLAIPDNLGDKISLIKASQDGSKVEATVLDVKQNIQSPDGHLAQKYDLFHDRNVTHTKAQPICTQSSHF